MALGTLSHLGFGNKDGGVPGDVRVSIAVSQATVPLLLRILRKVSLVHLLGLVHENSFLVGLVGTEAPPSLARVEGIQAVVAAR